MLLQYVAYSFPTEPRFLSRPAPRPPPAISVLHFAQRLSHSLMLYRYAAASPGTRLSSSAALASSRVRSAARGHFGKAPSAPSPNPWPIEPSSRPSFCVLHKGGYWLEPIHTASSRPRTSKESNQLPFDARPVRPEVRVGRVRRETEVMT
jgi:hypothetical protein